jgi:phytoene dehydrogenase-like protein
VHFGGDYAKEFRELFGNQLASDPTVYTCHPAATDASVAPEGQSGLFVMVNAPALQGDTPVDWGRAREVVRAQALEKLFAMDSSLRGNVEVLAERTPAELKAHTLSPGGSIYGFLPHGKFGPFRRPALRGETPGQVFVGGGTHPGGGVPLVMMSGQFAAGLVREHLAGGRR